MDEPITADKTTTAALRSHFGSPPAEVLGELGSMLVYYGIDAQELFYKWEAYCIKMGPEELKLELETVLNFKRDVKEQVEWEKRKAKMTPAKTPKRKFNASHMTPLKNTRVVAGASSPAGPSGGVTLSPLPIRTGAPPNKAPVSQPFSSRPNPGETLEILNAHLPAGIPAPEPWEARIRLSSNSEPKKFQFRPMHQKLTEASETLDDCIDEFAAAVQAAYNLPDEAFGDPAAKTPDTIVAVGRIVNDALEGRLNAKSVLLEASRQVGAGIRTLLKLDDVRSFAFFPGQIVALRGVNASGEYFAVSEVLELPPLPPAALTVSELNAEAERLAGVGMRVFVAAGPYTPDDNLAFEALDAICDGAAREKPDVLILAGPFLDSEHHMIKMGDYADLVDHENATIEDLFRAQISRRIARVQSSLVIMVPSTRDAVSRHAVYPQEALKRRGLDLPANVRCLPNPALFQLNTLAFALSTADILHALMMTELPHAPQESNLPARLTKHVLTQRNFYPLHPPALALNLDLPYHRLADMLGAVPDVLVLPSLLGSFAKVVDGVVAVNPGLANKKHAAGTWVELCVQPWKAPQEEIAAEAIAVEGGVWERARVEVKRV